MSATAQNTVSQRELAILSRFFFLAWGHSHGGAKVAAGLLLGLYNGTRFPFDLTDLRLLDAQMLDDALALMRFDSRPQMEVHEWLNQLMAATTLARALSIWHTSGARRASARRSFCSPCMPLKS